MRFGRLVLLAYLLVALGYALMQDKIMFPGAASQGQKYAQIQATRSTELIPLQTALGDQIYVLFGKACNHDGSLRSDADALPSIIFFYGNGNSLSDMTGLCREWRQLGANVMGVEYPGYGMSSGKPGEAAFYSAADSAFSYLAARPGIDPTKIIAAGQSLGTGVAIDLASRKPIAGVAIFSPYTSMNDMGRIFAPWLPTGLFLRNHFYNDQKIANLRVPILIAHGNHDSLIPNEMSHRLAAIAKQAQVTTLFVNSDHSDIFDRGGDQIDAALSQLIERIGASHQ